MAWLENQWARISPLHIVLVPVSLAFRSAVVLRRGLYRAGVLGATKLPVPVIVVGNITVGGSGKTPLVLWLVNYLRDHGMRPGIASRGYGGAAASPQKVTAESDPALCGDEPVMLAQRSGVPVWVGADRPAAARALLGVHPECDVIVTDDGLQHYRLARDIEIAVVDGARGFGNGLMLPAGPLREPVARLGEVDAVIVNDPGPPGIDVKCRAQFAMTLQSRGFQNLLNPDHRAAAELFHNRNVHAVAGIGNPRRFFEQLQRMGLEFTAHPFPDHHAFSAPDLALAEADFIVMTEKDAVKCRSFATEKHWVLRVDAEIDPAFGDLVLTKLGKSDGQ
jgi:tetraacyldisaccharide 4'-kinase